MKRELKILKRLIFAFILINATASFGTTLKPEEPGLSILIRTVDYVFTDSFPEAIAAATLLNDTIPGQPIYHLLYASILHAQMMDGEDYSREKEFMANVDSANVALERWIDKNPNDAWGYFFWGSAYGYKAVWLGQKGSSFKSLLAGLKAKARFFDALRLDSTLYDSYTGIGSYHYWSSVKLKKVFPFISDNRPDGLRELKLAMDSSLVSSKAAGIAYAWALLNERKYIDALKVANHLKEISPGGRTTLWLLAGIYWANGNLKKASDYYGQIVESLEKAGNQNGYNLIYCRYRKGVCDYNLKDYVSAKAQFDAILAYDPPKAIRERHKKTFDHTRDYLDKIKAQNQ
jgi:tetratricopeptide (TPR) repeat protein